MRHINDLKPSAQLQVLVALCTKPRPVVDPRGYHARMYEVELAVLKQGPLCVIRINAGCSAHLLAHRLLRVGEQDQWQRRRHFETTFAIVFAQIPVPVPRSRIAVIADESGVV